MPVDEVHVLFDEVADLPRRHYPLQLPLPRLLPPELEALRHAIGDDDPKLVDEICESALAVVDTPEQRADLARAVLELAESGRISADIADVAVCDLDSRSQALLRASLLHALSVSVGASRTPSGLLVVSR